jgi:hypothetical protein
MIRPQNIIFRLIEIFDQWTAWFHAEIILKWSLSQDIYLLYNKHCRWDKRFTVVMWSTKIHTKKKKLQLHFIFCECRMFCLQYRNWIVSISDRKKWDQRYPAPRFLSLFVWRLSWTMVENHKAGKCQSYKKIIFKRWTLLENYFTEKSQTNFPKFFTKKALFYTLAHPQKHLPSFCKKYHIKNLVGNVKRATRVSSKLQASSSKLQAPSSKLQCFWSDRYVFFFLKIFFIVFCHFFFAFFF